MSRDEWMIRRLVADLERHVPLARRTRDRALMREVVIRIRQLRGNLERFQSSRERGVYWSKVK